MILWKTFQCAKRNYHSKTTVHVAVVRDSPQLQINHFFTNGFWQTRSLWSLPLWKSITLASQRICVASIRTFSIAPTLSFRITHPWKPTIKIIDIIKQGEKQALNSFLWTGLVPQAAVYDPFPLIIQSCCTYLKVAVRGAHLHGANHMFVDRWGKVGTYNKRTEIVLKCPWIWGVGKNQIETEWKTITSRVIENSKKKNQESTVTFHYRKL